MLLPCQAIILFAFALCLPTPVLAQHTEADYNATFCAEVNGQQEVRHTYTYPGGQEHVFVDCETQERVYEGGLDKRSSLDSVQQALFFAALTGKQPTVVIYDTDGRMGQYEYRIQTACELAGVLFLSYANPRQEQVRYGCSRRFPALSLGLRGWWGGVSSIWPTTIFITFKRLGF